MNTVEHDSDKDLRPCAECPHILPRKFRQPLCSKAAYRNPVTGKPYQTCQKVRGLRGAKTLNGSWRQCLGYNAEKNATVSRQWIEET